MDRTTAEKAKDYTDAGDSVTVIDDLAAKSSLTDDEKDTMQRNIGHLEIMVAKTDWASSQSMDSFNAAITKGKAKL